MAKALRAEPGREHIEMAVSYLKCARERLRLAGAKRAAAYVQRALKSAQGAANHAARIEATGDKWKAGRCRT